MRALIAFFFLAAALATCSPPQIERGGGPVLVTVFSEAGRQAAPREGLYASYGLGVGQAATLLDAEALASLPQREMRAAFPRGAQIRTFSGPALFDVLEAGGVRLAGARVTALDGYQVEIQAPMIPRYAPILATHADGEPLEIGGLGPAILIWPRQTDHRLEDMNDELWPWGVFAIEALD